MGTSSLVYVIRITSPHAIILQNIVSPKSLLDCSLVNFAIYAKHIRNIVWTDGGVTPATLQLLAELAENFNGPLLPSLRSFEDHSIRHPPPLSLFPVPVKKLCFTPSNHKLKNHLSTLLAVVPSWSTELQELYIELFRKPDHLPTHEKDGVPSRVTLDRCLQALQKCFTRAIIHRGGYANLRVVRSYVPLPEQHFIALAHLPCLEILYIRFEGLERWRLKRLPALAFQAIRRMVLFFVYGAIASPLARIVENIASNKLEDLDLMFFKATQEDPSLARELFQAMARSAFRNALQYFTFDTCVPMGEDSARPPQFTMDAFSPLLSLPNLKGLRMLTPMSILTSRDIRALASAWSALQVISFVQGDRSEAAIHVEDLKEFADKCPQLRKIRFKVEAPDHWAPRASLMLDQIKPSLSVVENGCHIIAPGVGALSSGSRAFVSAYLRTLFPAAPFTLGSDPI